MEPKPQLSRTARLTVGFVLSCLGCANKGDLCQSSNYMGAKHDRLSEAGSCYFSFPLCSMQNSMLASWGQSACSALHWNGTLSHVAFGLWAPSLPFVCRPKKVFVWGEGLCIVIMTRVFLVMFSQHQDICLVHRSDRFGTPHDNTTAEQAPVVRQRDLAV